DGITQIIESECGVPPISLHKGTEVSGIRDHEITKAVASDRLPPVLPVDQCLERGILKPKDELVEDRGEPLLLLLQEFGEESVVNTGHRWFVGGARIDMSQRAVEIGT